MKPTNIYLVTMLESNKMISVAAERIELGKFGSQALFMNGKEIVGYFNMSYVESIVRANPNEGFFNDV